MERKGNFMKIYGKNKAYPVRVEKTKVRERSYEDAWVAITGNVVTTSQISEIQM